MRLSEIAIGLFTAMLMLGGCDGDGDGDDDDDTDPACVEVSTDGTLALADAQNYAFSGTLEIQSYPLQALSDPLFDWSGLTVDLQGHTLDPVADIDMVSVIIFNGLTEEEVEIGLSEDSLQQANIMFFVSKQVGDETSAHISELTLLGTEVYGTDYNFEPTENTTWLLTVSTGTIPGVGTRMAAFIRPETDATDTSLVVPNEATVLTFDADLSSLAELPMVSNDPNFVVDWENLTKNAQGNDFPYFEIDEVMVAQYESKTVADLEAEFLDLELIADAMWNVDIEAGYTGDLSLMTGDSGAFAGINETGTWILALRCNACSNPAPQFLTILHACEM